jgi:hypothetical protein
MNLIRVALNEHGMFGVLVDREIPFAVTLEPDGTQVKYIPSGVYDCHSTMYHKGGYPTFEIIVPGRERILFHKGNTEADTRGCVLVGESFGVLNGKPGILQSGEGFSEFMSKVGDSFRLTVSGLV